MGRKVMTLWIGLLLLAGAQPAQAHGRGMVLRQTQGAYEVVAVLAPEPLQVGLSDLTVSFHDAKTLQPTPVARLLVQIDDPTDALAPAEYMLTPEGNPHDSTFGTHQLALPHAGQWELRIIGVLVGAQVDVVMTVTVYSAGLIRWLEIGVYSLPLVILLSLIAIKRWYNKRDEQPESGI